MNSTTDTMIISSSNSNEDSGYDNGSLSDSSSSCSSRDSCYQMCLFSLCLTSKSSKRSKCLTHQCMVTNYNLSGNGIETLSNRTFQYLTNCVRELDLSNNQLHDLPDSISQLQILEVLNISQNQLSNLPRSLNLLHKLKVLKISKNRFKEVPECLEFGLEHLSHIDLSHNDISNFKNAPLCSPFLQSLDLSHNNFSFMPLWIFHEQCRSLLNLNMSFNFCLDDEIHRSQLECYKHHRTSGLKTIHTLNVANIGGKMDLFKSLRFFEGLECVHLGNVPGPQIKCNTLTDICVSLFYDPENIVELHLQSVGLTSVPKEFSKFKNLKFLDLSNNFLDWLPDNFGELVLLEVLILSSCDLAYLPKNFNQLVNLKKLSLNNNKLSDVRNELNPLLNLQWLDLYDNFLEEFPLSKYHLLNLNQVDVAYNYFDVEVVLCDESLKEGPEKCLLHLYKEQQSRLRSENPMFNNRRNEPKIQSTTLSSYSSYDSLHRSYSKSLSDDEESEINYEIRCTNDQPYNATQEEENWDEDSNFGDDNFDPNSIDRYCLIPGKYKFGWTPPQRTYQYIIPTEVILKDFVYVPGQIHPKATKGRKLQLSALLVVEDQFGDALAGDTVAAQEPVTLWDQLKMLQMFVRNPQGPTVKECRSCVDDDCWHTQWRSHLWWPF